MIEVSSKTWLFIKAWAETELQSAREQNDAPSADLARTQFLRGRIDNLKALLALPDEPRQYSDDDAPQSPSI